MSPEKKDATTALAVYEGPEYAVMKRGPDQLRKLFEANMDDMDAFDLDGVSVPGGGGLTWGIPDLNGEPTSVEEIEGVVVLKGLRRAYWAKTFDETGGGSPPDCSSLDNVTGTGYIRGDDRSKEPKTRACKTCPMAQWGSKKPMEPEDNQQACAKRYLLFLVREGDVIPQKIDLAPTSVGPVKKFFSRLTQAGIMKHEAIVGLRLINDKSRTGVKYSVVAPRLVSTLRPEHAAAFEALGLACEPLFKKTGIDSPPPADVVDAARAEENAEAAAAREKEETAAEVAEAATEGPSGPGPTTAPEGTQEELFEQE